MIRLVFIILILIATIMLFRLFRSRSSLLDKLSTEGKSLLEDQLTSAKLASVVASVIRIIDESRGQSADMKPRLRRAYNEAKSVKEYEEIQAKVNAFFDAASHALSAMQQN